MANPNPSPPGRFVFGRLRQLRALAPPDGVLGAPPLLCPPAIDSFVISLTEIPANPIVGLAGGGGLRSLTETPVNPTVVLAAT